MDERKEKIVEDVEKVNKEKVVEEIVKILESIQEEKQVSIQDEFEEQLNKMKTVKEAILLHNQVKKAVKEKNVDAPYLKYIENAIEDQLFCDHKFDVISPFVLIEVVCPALVELKEEELDIEQIAIEQIGTHEEDGMLYFDKICTYCHQVVCLFGISERDENKAIRYEKRKFSRQDRIEAVSNQYEAGKKVELEQYDNYFIGIEENRLKVFAEKKETALVKVEETPFEKIKSKLFKLFNLNLWNKKKYLPPMEIVFDSNPNRFKEIEAQSGIDAKNRIKLILLKEREQTRTSKES